jgi:hypothetical protein
MNSTKILLLGLPSSGKTTFLAALWFLVDGLHNTRLCLKELDGESEYLNSIRDKWLSCDSIDRTRRSNEPIISMKLVDANNSHCMDLIIPDLSGETFIDQWITRRWTVDFQEKVSGANGAILFIHPGYIDEGIRIDQVNIISSEISSEVDNIPESNVTTPVEWDPRKVPTQVQLVEILQFFEGFNEIHSPFKITIFISAWDLLRNIKKTPDEWLKAQLPLLYQYLQSNEDIFPYQIFGVSAQGGNYPIEQERLLRITEPIERIKVIGHGINSHDLTIPIVWLINNDE